VEKKKKGNTKAPALTEFGIAEKSKGRATDRAKPNEPETSSAAVSSLTIPTWASATGLQLEFHADTAVLGSIKKARSMEVLGEGSDRSRQSIKRVKSTRTLRELERAPCTRSGLRPRSNKAVAPNS
jgi:hypothetical protein